VEKRDYLYQYTVIFFSEVVSETIMIENWEEKDFDHRYIDYANVFLKIHDKCFSKNVADKEIIAILNSKKDRIVKLFNEKLGHHFRHEFTKRGYTTDMADTLIPKDIFLAEKININALTVFRDLEERVFSQKKEESR
jgi:disulfide oxidoreductase YuzD